MRDEDVDRPATHQERLEQTLDGMASDMRDVRNIVLCIWWLWWVAVVIAVLATILG